MINDYNCICCGEKRNTDASAAYGLYTPNENHLGDICEDCMHKYYFPSCDKCGLTVIGTTYKNAAFICPKCDKA